MGSAKRIMRRVLGLGPGDVRPSRRAAKVAAPPPNPFLRSADGEAARPAGFDVGEPEGRLGAALGRWLLRGLLALLIVIGVWTAFIKPFVGRSAPAPAAAPTLNVSAAEAAAARATAWGCRSTARWDWPAAGRTT